MTMEQQWLLKGLCLLAGYAFGSFMTADVVAHCLAGIGIRKIGNGQPSATNIAKRLGRPAGLAVAAGDALKTILACWFCYKLAAPELEHIAILYGGLGAVLGHAWPLWLRFHGGRGGIVVCSWLVVYLPITGVLCCLAGWVVSLGTGQRAWGIVLIPALAIPVAWVQFGMQSALAMLAVTFLLIGKYHAELGNADKEKPVISPKRPL